MKNRFSRWMFALTLLLICLAACQPQSADRAPKPAFKGMELYSWQTEGGDWRFALLPGTNRIKTVDEVQANPLDQAALKAALGELAVGETVGWFVRADGDTSVVLAFPPQNLIDAIIRRANQVDVHIEVVRP